MLRLHPRDSERRRAFAARHTRCWLDVGGRSWHVAPRPRAKRESRLAGARSFYETRADHSQRGTARTRSKLECCVSSPETASTVAPAPREPRGAGLALEAAAGTSHHGRAPKGRGLSPSQRSLAGREPQPARHRAHAKQARVLRLLPRDSERRRACAARATRRWLGVGGRSWHVAPRPRAKGESPLAGASPFYET